MQKRRGVECGEYVRAPTQKSPRPTQKKGHILFFGRKNNNTYMASSEYRRIKINKNKIN